MNAEIRSRSLIISVVIHAALFLLLLFFVMTTPVPPFPEAGGGGGVLVNIGYLDAASGDVQPISSTVTPDPQQVKAIPQPAPDEKITTQEDEESVAMNTSEKKVARKDVKKPPTDTKKPEPVKTVDAAGIYKGKSNKSVSQGTSTTGTGDQGDRQGDPNSKYTGKNGTGGGPGTGTGTGGGDGDGNGPGKGSGISFDLSGRKLLLKPSIDDRSQETGKVVVSITVDRAGNVTEARPGARGSTTTSSYLFSKAKEAAMKARFNASPEAADIQKGTMTFVFLVQ
ncbi:MAG: energy transducer TonB [Bacteroidetes bacterium]|nr:energy transducer TonB [Bacteroidota bacterium]